MFERWPKLSATLAILAIAVAVLQVIRKNHAANSRPVGMIWYYDLKTHALFPASDVSVPPIDTKSGAGLGVRAYVYSLEDDPNPTNRFVAFLEMLAPDTKREVEAELKERRANVPIGFALEKRAAGILVSAPDKIEWKPKFSPEGVEIMEAGKQKYGGRPIRPSLP